MPRERTPQQQALHHRSRARHLRTVARDCLAIARGAKKRGDTAFVQYQVETARRYGTQALDHLRQAAALEQTEVVE